MSISMMRFQWKARAHFITETIPADYFMIFSHESITFWSRVMQLKPKNGDKFELKNGNGIFSAPAQRCSLASSSALLQFRMITNIYMELKLMPCMLTEPGFITVVPSGYRCRDIWCSPAAEKSTCLVSRKPITPIGWCGGHMMGVAEPSLDDGPAIGCWMFDS